MLSSAEYPQINEPEKDSDGDSVLGLLEPVIFSATISAHAFLPVNESARKVIDKEGVATFIKAVKSNHYKEKEVNITGYTNITGNVD